MWFDALGFSECEGVRSLWGILSATLWWVPSVILGSCLGFPDPGCRHPPWEQIVEEAQALMTPFPSWRKPGPVQRGAGAGAGAFPTFWAINVRIRARTLSSASQLSSPSFPGSWSGFSGRRDLLPKGQSSADQMRSIHGASSKHSWKLDARSQRSQPQQR